VAGVLPWGAPVSLLRPSGGRITARRACLLPIAPVLLTLEAPSLTPANFRIILAGPHAWWWAYP
jgi:hypothetical protein